MSLMVLGDGFFGAAGHGEDKGVGGFALDEAGEGAAVVGLDGVGAPAGFEHAVGIKNVAEEGFRGHHFDVGERRAVQICLGRFQNASAATDRVPGAGDIRKAMHERFLMAMHE